MPDFFTIDPIAPKTSDFAVIQKVFVPSDQIPEAAHTEAVRGFLLSDAVASGIQYDFDFVQRIPEYIDRFIDNKSWECVYVSRAVAQPYYCCYINATDAENFCNFITASRPNGLGTTVETLDRVLEFDKKVQAKFRAIIQDLEPEQTILVNMDNPEKAAETLLKFYDKKALSELIAYLQKGKV